MRHAEGSTLPDAPRAIARAATLTSFGNLSSRVIGLVREMVKSFYFGNGQAASAFELAANIPTQFYDLLIGGMLSSALVPTFSELADEDDPARRRAFGELLGAVLGLSLLVLTLVVLVLWLLALPIARFISGGPNQDPHLLAALLRLTIPAILFLNLSGILTAALHARRRFVFTAFTATTYNAVMIVCVILLESRFGVMALAGGLLAGSIAQVLIQVPGLRGVPLRLSLNWHLPGVRQVVRLFLPVAGGLLLAQIAVQVSFILASRISAEGPATMRYAAQVIQFPLGMVAMAIATAILPALSSAQGEAFKRTLAQWLRFVWVLTAPATIGIYVLAAPIVALLFERGAFTPESTAYAAAALRAAAPGLLFAAVDTLLIYAFYAQRDTRTPTTIGIMSTLFYLMLVGAQTLLDEFGIRPFTLEALVFTNSLKTGVDAALMGFFLWRKIGGLQGYGLGETVLKVSLALGVMAPAAHLTMEGLAARFTLHTFLGNAVIALGSALVGALAYFLCAVLLRLAELEPLRALIARRLA